jgi:hypothetical protein
VQIDEDGDLYFVTARQKVTGKDDTVFLAGRGGVFGGPSDEKSRNPLTGSLIKSSGKDARILMKKAMVPLEDVPARLPDFNGQAWMEGGKWIYAGAGPIVFGGCECPTMRFHTDWYKRTFVPEQYRHSIGVLDANGNLIMHIGQYGNLDSADGPKARIPVGGDGIGITYIRFVGGTDNRLVFDNHGEQIVCLKLSYYAEETVGIGGK